MVFGLTWPGFKPMIYILGLTWPGLKPTIYYILGLTWPGLKPTTYYIRGEHTNHYTTSDAVLLKFVHFFVKVHTHNSSYILNGSSLNLLPHEDLHLIIAFWLDLFYRSYCPFSHRIFHQKAYMHNSSHVWNGNYSCSGRH